MTELAPGAVSALDQFSGVCGQLADITVSHHERLLGGGVPHELASTLTGDLHDALLEVFILPKQAKDPDED